MDRLFSRFASNPDVKHVFSRLEPVTDKLIAKAAASFKNGGKVTGGKMGSAKLIKAHVGEYVLPAGVKPTLAQKKMVAKMKAAAKKRL